MTVRAILDKTHLEVDPGSKVATEIEIVNTGDIVEDFRFELVGPAAPWASVDPAEVALFPGDSAKANVTFAPPRKPTTRAAELPFGVKVVPLNDPAASVVEEGRLEVKRFVELNVEPMPDSTRGRLHGKLGVVVDSMSNVPVSVALKGQDASGRLGVRAKPPTASIAPGQSTFFKVKVKPHHRIYRGTAQSHRYKLVAEPDTGEPVKKDATHLQRSIFPRGALPLAGLAIVGLVVLMFLRAQPSSTAVTSAPSLAAATSSTTASSSSSSTRPGSSTASSQAAAQQTTSSTSSTSSSSSTTSSTSPSSTTTTSEPGASSTTTVPASSTTTTTAPTSKLPAPFGQTLEVVASPGSSGEQSYSFPSGEVLQVSEVLFENVQPDSGVVRLEVAPPSGSSGSSPQDLFFTGLSGLSFQTLSFSQQPVSIGPGSSVIVSVSCDKSSSQSCDAGAFISGQLTAAPSSSARRR